MIQAAVTMNQLQNKLDLIGHNMANSQTPGYKTRRSEFSSLLAQEINNMNAPENADNRLTPEGIRVGTGARLGAIVNDYSLGSLQTTNRALDIALRNEHHFFQIQTEADGAAETQYTRDGSFYLRTMEGSGSLMLTNGDGLPVLGQNGAPIVIAGGFEAIDVRDNGDILVVRNGQEEVAGTIAAVTITEPQVLEAAGGNLFRMPDVEELGVNPAELIQPLGAAGNLMENGVLEQSNVDVASQMSELLTTQRAYQFNARTISTTDQMMGLVNQLRS
jgi:flagellar basal-body rod protein FlgG